MTGTFDGITVTWGRIAEGASVPISVDQAVYAEYQRSQWAGPAGQPLKLSFTLVGATAWATAKSILRLARVHPLHVASDSVALYFDEPWVFLRVARVTAKRYPGAVVVDLEAEYVGNHNVWSLGLVATAKQRANDWLVAGKASLRIPGGDLLDETLTDASRNVLRSPTAFAALEASYQAAGILRNASAPVQVRFQADLSPVPVAWTEHLESGSTVPQHGSGIPVEDGDVVRNVSVSLAFAASTDTVTASDRLTGISSQALVFGAWTRWVYAGAGLPSTPLRRLLVNELGQRIEVHDNGDVVIDPNAQLFKVSGSATRSLGTGVYYHAVKTNTYLVGTKDFSVAADGTVSSAAGAVFGLVFTTATGTPLTDRLREVFMEMLPSWTLLRRTR